MIVKTFSSMKGPFNDHKRVFFRNSFLLPLIKTFEISAA